MADQKDDHGSDENAVDNPFARIRRDILNSEHFTNLALMLSPWPDLPKQVINSDVASDTWTYYSGLLKNDASNWFLIEAHAQWMKRSAEEARLSWKSTEVDVLRRRMLLYANLYENKVRVITRLQHRYLSGLKIRSWEEEAMSSFQGQMSDPDARKRYIDEHIMPAERSWKARFDLLADRCKEAGIKCPYSDEFSLKTTMNEYTRKKRKQVSRNKGKRVSAGDNIDGLL